jgi:exonuclease III
VRLDYRVDQWDKHMKEYLSKHAARKPVVYAGDLNVGHLDLDIHNPEAKHIVKQAGLTVRERQAHSELLGEGGEFVDSLRYFYPGW